MSETSQKVALVTGGTKGIGLATALNLVEAGHKVAVGSRTKPDDLPESLSWFACDITSTESVDGCFDQIETELGPVQILVANAGMTNDMLMLRMDEEAFSKVIDANLTGTFRTAKRAIKPMMKTKWGRIVMLGSIVGTKGQAGQANYAASKAGLKGFAMTMAKEFASRNITVNLVSPGPIATDMLQDAGQEAIDAMANAAPVGRVGTPDEVAAAIGFLVSEDAGYITGINLPVDGGLGIGG